MSTIQNNTTVGHVNGCCKITFVGKNLTTSKYAIYGITIGIPQEGVSYDDENILGRAVETENVFNCRGNLATKQKGNQTINEKTFDIVANDDFNYVVNNISPIINRDTFRAILKGTKFKNVVSGEEIAVLGVQGQSWVGGDEFTTLDTFYWFEDDGKLIKADQLDSDGNPVLVGNTIKAPYEKSALLMVEFLYAFDATKKNGDRFAYCMPMSSTFSEGSGTSPNSHSFSMERFSDTRSIKEYYLQGGNMDGDFPVGSVTAQKGLTVKYFTSVTPTDGGEIGDFIATVIPATALTVSTSASADAGGSTLTGIGTAFDTELVVGSIITFDSQVRIVSAIASATSLTVSVPYVGAISAVVAGTVENRLDVVKVIAVGATYTSVGTNVTFAKGTNIHFEKVVSNADLDDASTLDEYGVAIVVGAGTNQIACVYDDDLDGTGNKYVKKYDWNYASNSLPYMEAYDGTED